MSGLPADNLLTPRLEEAARLVHTGVRLCDVGCDHAYLPIALCLREKIPSAIAMDIRTGPLRAAEEHVRQAALTGRIDLRRSDGLSALREGEAEAVSVMGMGGKRICQILQQAPFPLTSLSQLLLGPQSHPASVRCFLAENGFRITEEVLVREEGKIYLLIAAEPGRQKRMTEEEEQYGPVLLERHDPCLYEQLTTRHALQQALLARLQKQSTAGAAERMQSLKQEAGILKKALERYEM